MLKSFQDLNNYYILLPEHYLGVCIPMNFTKTSFVLVD